MATPPPKTPWHAAYPVARSQPSPIDRAELLDMLKASQTSENGGKKDWILVDLRRVDHEGGTIRGSINLPAQSLYPSIPTLYTLFKAAGVNKIIWYCGSSKGRGNRAAAWFADYIGDQKDQEMRSLVLEGGITGWVAAGEGFVEMVDEFEAEVWEEKE